MEPTDTWKSWPEADAVFSSRPTRAVPTRRAARGRSAEAKAFPAEWTPRGWMRPDLDLLGFEQQLYLRQPGYGTSYITGKPS